MEMSAPAWDILLQLAEGLERAALQRRDLLETRGAALRSEPLPAESCLCLGGSFARQRVRRGRGGG
jgi:hypothetical protein